METNITRPSIGSILYSIALYITYNGHQEPIKCNVSLAGSPLLARALDAPWSIGMSSTFKRAKQSIIHEFIITFIPKYTDSRGTVFPLRECILLVYNAYVKVHMGLHTCPRVHGIDIAANTATCAAL